MRLLLSLTLLAGIATVSTAEENWPAWRGAAANGVAAPTANPPTRWGEGTNVKWKVTLPGKGSATPVVWGEQVFVVMASKTDREAKADELPKVDPRFETKTQPPTHFHRFEVHSYDRATGKLRWKQTATEAVPHEGHHASHSYAAGSPTTDGKRLYVSFGSFGVYAYDLEGKLLWKRDLGRMHTRLAWGEAVTPVVHGDTLLLNWDQEADSRLIALNAATGETKWETKRDEKTSWNTPLVVEHRGKTHVVVNGTNRLRSYDLATGKVIWEAGAMTTNAIPSPLAADGVVYAASGYKGSVVVAVPLDATGDVKDKVLWRSTRAAPYVPSPLLYQGRLYLTQANTAALTVLDAKTGDLLTGGVRLPELGQLYASPLAAGGRLYFVDREGTTVVLSPGDAPKVLAVNKLDDAIDASPVAVGKTLFLRGAKYLYAIEER